MTWVWRASEAQGMERFVLLAIADAADDEGGNAFPSMSKLVDKTGLSERTVRRAIRSCEQRGELHTEQEKRAGRVVGNRYDFPSYATGQSDRRSCSPPVSVTGSTTGQRGPGWGQSDRGGGVTVTALDNRPLEPSNTRPRVSPPSGEETCRVVQPSIDGDPTDGASGEVGEVWDAYRSSTNRQGRYVLTTKRKRLILQALRDYPLDDVLDAVRGWEASPFHRGENDRGHPFNDLELLLRDAEHIEKFRDLARGVIRPTPQGRQTSGQQRDEAEERLRQRLVERFGDGSGLHGALA